MTKKKQLVHVFTLNGKTYQEMVSHIRRLLLEFNIVQINIDNAGGGATLKDLLAQPYTTQDGKIMMPILDGFKATQHIKATPKGKHTIIIALSANVVDEGRRESIATGCDDFLPRPFRAGDIFDLLHKHLGVRFVYEVGGPSKEQQEGEGNGQKAEGEDMLNSQALTALPKELVIELHHSVDALDVSSTFDILTQIRQQDKPFAEAVAKLVNDYRFDILQEFFATWDKVHEGRDKLE